MDVFKTNHLSLMQCVTFLSFYNSVGSLSSDTEVSLCVKARIYVIHTAITITYLYISITYFKGRHISEISVTLCMKKNTLSIA